MIVSYDMKTSFGANNKELLIPVDPEGGQYGATGLIGASDSSSATGTSDSSSATGLSGSSDSSGATGLTGSSGTSGATGSSGTSGATGSSYDHEESSLMRSPELNGNVQSTRYVKFFTLVVVVAALLGSTMYLTSSIRGNLSRRLSMDKESYPDATKTIDVGPHTTIKDIIDQLLWGPSPPEDESNDHEKDHCKPKPTPQPTLMPNIRSNPLPTYTMKPYGIFTPNSILTILYCLLIVNVKFIISSKLP
jgi:hypothetical protein